MGLFSRRNREPSTPYIIGTPVTQNWAGIYSWALPPMPVALTRWSDNAARPWVKTQSTEPPPTILTSGSDLNRAAEGPWRPLIDAGLLDFKAGGAAWPANNYRTVRVYVAPANYGSETSIATFGSRRMAFPETENVGELSSIAGLPGPIPDARRPMWGTLLAPLFNMRVANPNTTPVTTPVQRNPNAYSLGGSGFGQSASLNASGAVPSEVLL